MLRLAHTRILFKLSSVVLMIGVIVGACIWYGQSQMTTIDGTYNKFISREARGATTVQRLNRLTLELNYWAYRIITETDDPQLVKAGAKFEAIPPQLNKALLDLRQQAPTFAARIEEQARVVKQFVKDVGEVRNLGSLNRWADALKLVHNTIDPNFDAMMAQGVKLSEDIATYMGALRPT